MRAARDRILKGCRRDIAAGRYFIDTVPSLAIPQKLRVQTGDHFA
jgi:hypothetical protein